MPTPTVGIDLGTSNSSIAFYDGRSPQIIDLPDGSRLLPSVVTATPTGKLLVGKEAIEEGLGHPDYCYRRFKRSLAEPWIEGEDTGHQTIEGRDGTVWYRGPTADAAPEDEVLDHCYSPIELSSYVMSALLDAAEEKFSERPRRAVICVPAGFTDAQRGAVEEAAGLAGLESVVLLDEPTAAAIAYGYDFLKTRRIAVFDLGGGTFDISIIQTGRGLVEVLATNGNRKLGGIDFDRALVEYVSELWRHDNGEDLGVDDHAMSLLRNEAETVKMRLSIADDSHFNIYELSRSSGGEDQHMTYPITREQFNDLTQSLREATIRVCRRAKEDIQHKTPNFDWSDLHDVVLVGGMTRIPAVREAVEAEFGIKPKRDINPEEVVALGAALKGAEIDGRKLDLSIQDVTAHSLCVENHEGVAAILVPKGTQYPFEETFTLANFEAGQGALSAVIVEGEEHFAADCDLVCSFHEEVQPVEREQARTQLLVSIDANNRRHIQVGGTVIHGGD